MSESITNLPGAVLTSESLPATIPLNEDWLANNSYVYVKGEEDYARGIYNPPSHEKPDFSTYLRGYNDAWAKANNRTIWR